MPLPLFVAIALVAGQTSPSPANAASAAAGRGRLFVSPMGEPLYGRTQGEDGLVVWFEQVDRNHDGAITSDEMAADAARFFAVLDRQGDGEIDPGDMDYYEGVIAPQVRAQSIVTVTSSPGGDVTEHVDNESAAAAKGLLAIPQPVASADRNFDRGVSAEEFRAAAARRFQMLDPRGTGRLTLAQLQEQRRAATAVAKRRSESKPDMSDDPHSAENGTSSIPQ